MRLHPATSGCTTRWGPARISALVPSGKAAMSAQVARRRADELTAARLLPASGVINPWGDQFTHERALMFSLVTGAGHPLEPPSSQWIRASCSVKSKRSMASLSSASNGRVLTLSASPSSKVLSRPLICTTTRLAWFCLLIYWPLSKPFSRPICLPFSKPIRLPSSKPIRWPSHFPDP